MPKRKVPIWEKKKNEALQLLNDAMANSLVMEENLPDLLAEAWAWNQLWEDDYNRVAKVAQDYEYILKIFSQEKFKNPEIEDTESARLMLLNMFAERGSTAANLLKKGIQNQRSYIGRKMADAKHDKPGGSREKQKMIREIWSTGKYSSRDRCAEEECGALGMSFSSARKALRNTPTPKR